MRSDASKPRFGAGVRGGRELPPCSTGFKTIQELMPAALATILKRPSKRSKPSSDAGFDGMGNTPACVPPTVLMALSGLLPGASKAPQNRGHA